MFAFSAPSVFQGPKCYFTYGTMGHLDPQQLPSSKKPWATINSLGFIHKMELILPQECAQVVKDKLVERFRAPSYERVIMRLSELLTGDFFNEYIKIGNVLMLSEGRPGQDNVFMLRGGTLVMFLDRESYERAGLVGQPHGVKGKRGTKPRWVVEFDLKAKSMFPGKKGFDRLLYASKNVLSTPVTWLFCNCGTTPDPDPLAPHYPTRFTCSAEVVEGMLSQQPPLKQDPNLLSDDHRLEAQEFATELYEWLSLVRLQSPRVAVGDAIDSHLSRYQVPGDADGQQSSVLCKVGWEGFFPSSAARQLLVDTIVALPSKAWFAASISTFGSSKGLAGDGVECTVMRPPKAPGEYLLWEVKGHE